MLTSPLVEGPRLRPVVALLAAHWQSSTEDGWITRQVAGALAWVADVHVITPDGDTAGASIDSVFWLNRLATPIAPAAELGRDLLIEGLSESGIIGERPIPPEMAALVDRDLVEPWEGASAVLAALRPDLSVIVGHRNVGALVAVDRHSREMPVSLIALGSDSNSLAFPHFDPLFDRAISVLAVTEAERRSIVELHGRPETVHRIGAPLAANPSALSEPNTWVGDTDYILVLTGVASDDEHAENRLSRLLRMRFPDRPVGIAHRDAFCAWHKGRLNMGWPVERSSDLARLMAWATVTVDLRPGRLFARRCVDSLLYGTPIVVPHDSRGREHAQRGRGGLWFHDAPELAWCVESMLEPTTNDIFGAQGRSYAEEEYGSTDRFIERVTEACGLDQEEAPAAFSA
jgi:hypothetical protein